MEHKNLSLESDRNLINKILDDIDMRYIILFLYVIRNDLFKNSSDKKLLESFERILILDEVFKGNLLTFWSKEFIEIAIDLGLIRNIRSLRDFEQKDDDFIVKLGEETITIENDTILTPSETLFVMITKKFKFLMKRNFNLALTRLKGVSCEVSNIIHPFVYEIRDQDYMLSDDLYRVLDQFGNIYQAIKIEVTIEGFYQRFKEILEKIEEYIDIFDPILNGKNVVKKINDAINENKDIMKHLKDENIKLSDKFNFDNIDKSAKIFNDWLTKLLNLLNYRFQITNIDDKLLEIKKYYSGKKKKCSYLEFIEKVSFNEDNIVNDIQDSLISLRKELIEINNQLSELTKKDVKLLNLDYEKFILTTGDRQ